MTGIPSRTVHRLAPADLVHEAGALLGTGWRLALVATPRPLTRQDDPRAVYLFLAPAPAGSVELHVGLDPFRPGVPDLGPLSAPARRFALDLHAADGAPTTASLLPRQLGQPLAPDGRRLTGAVPSFDEPALFPLLHAHGARPLAGQQLTDGLALVERFAGDTPVGHALAYCRAVEDALGLCVPEDARRMRAVLLELERLRHHLEDVAELCRHVGLGTTHEQAHNLVDVLSRTGHAMTGSRTLRGGILVGGATVRRVIDPDALGALGHAARDLVDETLDDPAIHRRLSGTATLTKARAHELGALGVVARASGLDVDARRDHPTDVLADFGLQLGDILPVPVQTGGDVAARFRQRGTEVEASIAALDTLVRTTAPGLVSIWPTLDHRRPGPGGVCGVGISEGWRGTVVHRVEIDAQLRLADARAVDPCFFNSAALQAALADGDPDDVPLVRSSFSVPPHLP